MRMFLTVTTSALALAACGPKASDTASNAGAMSEADNITLAQTEGTMTADNTAMATPVSTDDFLAKAAMSDMYEVQAGKLAATMAANADVKKFGQMMVDAHTTTTTALKAAVKKDGVTMTPPAALDAKHQGLIDALKAAKGDAFDTLYKSQQSDAHAEALALMQGYAATGDKPAIKAFAADTAPKVQSHIDMLNSLG